MSDLLTTRQVADLLGVHPDTVRGRARKGNFPAPDVPSPGGRASALWNRATVDEWITWRAELIGVYEIAEWLEVSPHTVRVWWYQITPPPPDFEEGNLHLWHWQKIQEWASNFIEWKENPRG